MANDNIIIYGTTWCVDCKRSKEYLAEHRIAYEWIDIEGDKDAIAKVEELNNGMRSVPTILFSDGTVLVEPSNDELAKKLDIVEEEPQHNYWDLVIIGGGPAGLSAAIYGAREGLSTLVLERAGIGGQAAITQTLDNYPGFEEGISGLEFSDRLGRQAERFGVDIRQGEEIVDIVREGQFLIVKSVNERDYIASAVVIATGSQYKQLGIPGEWDLIGYNVHFCATCDGALYQDKDVLVIGGGNSGFEEGLHLTHFANKVDIVEFMPEFKASEILQDKVAGNEKMNTYANQAVQEFVVDHSGTHPKLDHVKVLDRETGVIKEWTPDGVFVFIGLNPNTNFLPDTIEKDQWGFLKTTATLETSLPGVFAAGDVREGSSKQVVSAAGEGATAALMVRQYLQRIGEARDMAPVERELAGD